MTELCPLCEAAPSKGPCKPCRTTLTHTLQTLPALLEELETSITRQGRTVQQERRSQQTPLPFPIAAMEARRTLHTAIRAILPPGKGVKSLPTLIPQILTHPQAATQITALTDAVHQATQIIDIPAGRALIGMCAEPCNTLIWVNLATTATREAGGRTILTGTATCRCAKTYDIEKARAALTAWAEHHWTTLSEAPAMLEGLGITIPEPTIRSWAKRGKLPIRGHRAHRPLYKLGDILDVYLRTHQKKHRAA